MKINPDCIRDILFMVEAHTDLRTPLGIDPETLPNELSAYQSDEVMYHVKQCELSGLFAEKMSWYASGGCMIRYLSPYGHQFLSDIRSDTSWNKTKDIAKKLGVNSINTLKDIAASVITSLIQNQLNLN